MKSPLGRTLLGFFSIVLLISITLYSSSDVRDWFETTFILSEVRHPRPTPPAVLPARDSSVSYLQFFVVGDAGTGGHGQQQVANAMGRTADEDTAAFVLYLGGNFYESGVSSVTDPQWNTKFEKVFTASSLQIPFYAVLGTIDYRSNPQAQVEYSRLSSRWRMPDRYYTFSSVVDDSTTVQFFCLDSYPIVRLSREGPVTSKGRQSAHDQLHWLEHQLARSTARWKIIAAHHPLYSNGAHGNDSSMIAAIGPLLDRYAVDFFVAGHDHDLELLKPVAGVTHVISGAGGKHRDIDWRDNTVFAATNLGYTMFRISAGTTYIEFFNREGRPLYAHRFEKPLASKPSPFSGKRKDRRL